MSIDDDIAAAKARKETAYTAWKDALATRNKLEKNTHEWTTADLTVRLRKRAFDTAHSRLTKLEAIKNRR